MVSKMNSSVKISPPVTDNFDVATIYCRTRL